MEQEFNKLGQLNSQAANSQCFKSSPGTLRLKIALSVSKS